MRASREPAVAGRFYPSDPVRLTAEVDEYLVGEQPAEALALVAPHAGYMYSGKIAGRTYSAVRVPAHAIVICPNHTGFGVKRSVWSSGSWMLPVGEVAVDASLAGRLCDEACLEADEDAHLAEHAIEVQLPFLRASAPGISVVPICLARLSYADCVQVGQGIARVVEERRAAGEQVLLVASTDMSHYISAEQARRLDQMAIEQILKIDPEGLYQTVTRHSISMCGYIPTTVVLAAAKQLGGQRCELIAYGNSGDASGDHARVVGYAGLVVR
ncbi:MAG TPA: AmmeMemoRadiSam system protein B [Polyangiaceae bacterium]